MRMALRVCGAGEMSVTPESELALSSSALDRESGDDVFCR